MTTFPDRSAAGRALTEELAGHAYPDPVVLALPRGGVPVAAEVARRLHAPLDLVMARKIAAPDQPEVALGAVVDGQDPFIVMNSDVLALTGLPESYVRELARAELAEITRRRRKYLGNRASVPLTGRTAIVVDDGIATGATMRVALRAVDSRGPRRTVLAVPVAPSSALTSLQAAADDVVCLAVPRDFYAVGQFYDDFHQVSDREVIALLP